MHRSWGLILAMLLVAVGCSPAPVPRPDTAILTQTPEPGVDYVSIVGDSDTSGSAEGGLRRAGWPALATANLRTQGLNVAPRVSAMGGAGYLVTREAHSARSFTNLIRRSVGTNTRLVVIFGSRNDKWAYDDTRFPAAVEAAFAEARARAPLAYLLVIGPMWTSWATADPDPELLTVRDIVRSQAEAAGTVFIDPINEQWFRDRPDLVGSDGVNPTDDGHAYLAEKIAPLLKQVLESVHS